MRRAVHLEQAAAIGASIVVHAIAAWGVASLRPVVEPAPPRAMSVQLVEAPPRFEPEPPRAAAAKPQAVSRSAARPSPPAHDPVPAPSAESTAQAAVPPPPASATGPAPQAVAQAVEPSLDDYRRRVWAHLAARAPSSPPGSGTATVMFGLDEDGAVLFARLARSSGRPAFDRACVASVRAAAPLPPPPAGTRPEDLVFTIPIRAAQRR